MLSVVASSDTVVFGVLAFCSLFVGYIVIVAFDDFLSTSA